MGIIIGVISFIAFPFIDEYMMISRNKRERREAEMKGPEALRQYEDEVEKRLKMLDFLETRYGPEVRARERDEKLADDIARKIRKGY
ncbi:MAG: hypothetical protein IJI87_07805 [Mogibacterium sp.]|nr:hypothetical protein [Mogibacterium sp.]